MKKLNPNSVFRVFDRVQEDGVEEEEGRECEVGGGVSESVRFGLCISGVGYYGVLDEINSRVLGSQYVSLREGVKYRYFTKMYQHLESVGFNSLEGVLDFVDQVGLGEVLESLDILSSYFLDIEEYERCGRIRDVRVFLKKICE